MHGTILEQLDDSEIENMSLEQLGLIVLRYVEKRNGWNLDNCLTLIVHESWR